MTTPQVLWTPPADARSTTRLGQFLDFCGQRHGRSFAGYDELWEWSVGDGVEDCWAAIWDFFDVSAAEPYEQVLDDRTMPGARWFAGARLNYATHVLRWADERSDEVAIVGRSQARERVEMTWGQLAEQVARARCGLRARGVGEGDRVAAYLPNVPETIVAFLAACSLGATWTSCAPEFGVQAVLDRFAQVEPTVLLAVDRYRYGSHTVDRVVFKTERGYGIGYFAVTIVAELILGFLASMIVFWFSRWREFRADAAGASLTTNGHMIAALQRLQAEQGLPQDLPGELTAFGISEQMKEGFAALFRSHPPLEDRIRALQG